jgi:serralysin
VGIDATPPSIPTVNIVMPAGGNKPVFSGSGEAGTTIELYRDGDFTKIGSAVVDANGAWSLTSQPLPNGNYNVIVTSLDLAGNARAGQATAAVSISHAGYQAGTANADTIVMNPGSTAVDAGVGIDTVVFSGARADFAVKKETWGYSVTGANGEVDGLFNVERIQFSDGWKAIDNNSATIFRLYQAVMGRESDDAGLGFWTKQLDNGTPLTAIASGFMQAKEFADQYGANPTNQEFIYKLYDNVLDRAPDAGGLLFWTAQIDSIGKAQMVIEFSESPENQALVIDTVGKGLDFIPYA